MCSAFNLTHVANGQATVDGVSVNITRGSLTAIVGGADSGARELAYCLAGAYRITSGRAFLDGVELSGLNDKALRAVRRRAKLVSARGVRSAAEIARARSARPAVLFVDTDIDDATLGYLRRMAHAYGQTVVVVTADPAVAMQVDRALVMHRGRLVADC